MNSYQFERIAANMSKKYGKIRKGEESGYEYSLFAMESNLLIKHRQNPSCSAVQAKEGIMLALHTINGYITGQKPELEPFMRFWQPAIRFPTRTFFIRSMRTAPLTWRIKPVSKNFSDPM